MDTLHLSISPWQANHILAGLVFTVTAVVNGRSMPDCLDVDEFFTAFNKSGWFPIFNCSCGAFGCGGYYVDVRFGMEHIAWMDYRFTNERARNILPFENCSFRFSRENLRDAGGELLAVLYTVTAQCPSEEVRSGTTGVDLAARLSFYQEQYDSL